jgi:hypothetical protein
VWDVHADGERRPDISYSLTLALAAPPLEIADRIGGGESALMRVSQDRAEAYQHHLGEGLGAPFVA